MRSNFFKVCCLLLLAAALQAQPISFHYDGETLGYALDDLGKRYDLLFTYSPSRLPMSYELYAEANKQPLPEALDVLLTGVPVKHAFIGNQIVLRSSPKQMTRIETKAVKPRQKTPLYQERRPTPPAIHRIPSRHSKKVEGGNRIDYTQLSEDEKARLEEAMHRHERITNMQEYDETHRLAQISLLPYLGTNTHRSNEITNKISLNVFWGTSKAIDGFELGGVGNMVVEDVWGFQGAGVFNKVGGSVTGTQVAGGVNIVDGQLEGLQLAGLGNMVKDSVIGNQLAGLFNISDYHVDGNQTAALFNWAEGDVQHQSSVLYNHAHTVSKRQVALVNRCDSTAKAPIGLLNLVRYGYNRVEVGTSEALFANMGLKLGVHKLYTVLQLGLRWDLVEETINDQEFRGMYSSWALGYGVGVVTPLGKKWLLNTELVGMHVNELEAWTNRLNALGVLKMTLDFQPGKVISFYAGPTLNMMWSHLHNRTTDVYGSRLPHKPLWNEQNSRVNFQGWLGFSAGIRL